MKILIVFDDMIPGITSQKMNRQPQNYLSKVEK